MQSEQINELATALSKAQGTMKSAAKDASNPFFKSKYADLASVWDACRDALSTNGLSVIQTTQLDGANIYLLTTLAHASGQWVSSLLPVEPVKRDPQGVGSAITYMRRYALAAIVGVAPEDDDGNAASGHKAGVSTVATDMMNAKVKPTTPSATSQQTAEPSGNAAGAAVSQPGAEPPPALPPMSESTFNTICDLMIVVPPAQKTIETWLSRAGVDDIRKVDEERGMLIVKSLKAKSEKQAEK